MSPWQKTASGDCAALCETIRTFFDKHDWDQFHTQKNQSFAPCVEAAELPEYFQWPQSGNLEELGDVRLEPVRHEIADVLVYLVRLADKLAVDLNAAVEERMVLNRAEYPAYKVHGGARKYYEYKGRKSSKNV